MSLDAKPEGAAGIDLAGLGDLASMLDAPMHTAGEATYFDLAVIHEDEGNSRTADNPGFSAESINELATSIAKKGIKSPISLRPHPTMPGRFVINHGHRRFRAAGVAGLTQVPAFVDADFDDIDQVIENVQRENLTAREIADFIGRKLSEGMAQADVAGMLGKSRAWVSQHVRMLSLPDPVAHAVVTGKVQDVTLANELASAHREAPAAVEALLTKTDTKPTRSTVKEIRRDAKVAKPSPMRKPNREAMASAKAELQRRRNRDALTHSEPADLSLHREGVDALWRLIKIANQYTGQSKRVADFLLAWWNATSCGGFDLTDLWSVDREIADDMMRVLSLIRQTKAYPGTLSPTIHAAFKSLVTSRRPHLVDE
ncbi:hypothetical protein CAL26_01240 [Bordetella genomosp. 9]|uniref:ParB-like N-terminal domain-containing protein n=1 Tax=Bordetella genomosp. 9 TaxID=1416803 RepID=A0A261RM95_9BORD|nr:ParB/RepB/Spo0J family partition protein [Bordetella genomosp. 9]OZI26011.1 hypothetical protein CAL26_01240 [Bordetella genomosp. 9]